MRDIIRDAISRAAQQETTQPLPRSAPARMRHLVEALGGTRAASELLGISQGTVRRYVRGKIQQPRPRLASALEAELRRRWQPGLQRRAIDRAKRNGFAVEARASFGYAAPGGTTDEPRMRLIPTQWLPPATASKILDAYQRGAPDQEMKDGLADALAEQYFRDGGRRADGLKVEFGYIDYVDVEL